MALLFESETCSRCGGSGHYSYCQSYGTTCFKCAGTKAVLTKRGRQAQNLFNRLLSRPVSSLRPGDKFKDVLLLNGGDLAHAWFTVQSIEPNADGTMRLETDRMTYANISGFNPMRVAVSRETKARVAGIALAYQSILTASGKEPKWLSTIAYG